MYLGPSGQIVNPSRLPASNPSKLSLIPAANPARLNPANRVNDGQQRTSCQARKCTHLVGGEPEQLLLLRHISIQSTERNLSGKQELSCAVNDKIGLELESGEITGAFPTSEDFIFQKASPKLHLGLNSPFRRCVFDGSKQ